MDGLATYFQLMTQNGSIKVYHQAVEMGILRELSKSPLSLEKLAKRCQCLPKPLKLVMDILLSLDIADREGELYYPGPVIEFLTENYIQLGNPYWDHLGQYLKSSQPLIQMDDDELSEQYYVAQAKELAAMMAPSASEVAKILQIGTKRKHLSVLDIGAGAGTWGLSLASSDPHTRITAVDWPAVLFLAEQLATARGIASQLQLLPGNYHEVTFPDRTYDLAIMGNVCHLEEEEGNLRLFKKVKKSLKPNGELLVIDVFATQSNGKMTCALYALGLALRTRQGTVFSVDELKERILEAGYSSVGYHPLEVPPFIMGMLLAKS